jgi:hypothetical protein
MSYPPPPSPPPGIFTQWTNTFCACGKPHYRRSMCDSNGKLWYPPYEVFCVRGHSEVLLSPTPSPEEFDRGYSHQSWQLRREEKPVRHRQGFAVPSEWIFAYVGKLGRDRTYWKSSRVRRIPVRAKGKGVRTLSFEDAGKAIRILMRELGARPYCNSNRNSYLDRIDHSRRLDYRMVIWDVRREPNQKCAAIDGPNLFSGTRPASRVEKAAAALVAAGITDFRVTFHGWLYIRVPKDCFACSFYGSDDPQEWARKDKQRHDAIVRRKKIRETLAALDGAA